MRRLFLILAAIVFARAGFGADGPCVLAGQGYFRIHVGTGGLFGSFAHNHLIEAQKISGCATVDPKDISHSSIKLSFPTSALRVMDPKESANDRAQVQKTMETEVLRVSEYPEVTFESTGMERGAVSDQLRVRGNLTIRGKTQPALITLTLTRTTDGTYEARGQYGFKQTTFGIKPIQLGGGTIKVKDELDTEFDLFLR